MKLKPANIILILILSGTSLWLSSCRSSDRPKQEIKEAKPVDTAQLIGKEPALLLNYLNELGDYVNSRNFPSLIKASSVFEDIGKNQLIVDIRSPEHFAKGHIEGSVNVEFSDIPEYFESKIVPFKLDRIIIVSDGGQASSYTTCLLRLMGYGNVYSMRWGMSGWNKDFAKENWSEALGSGYQDRLEKSENEKASPSEWPELHTGKTTGEEILLARADQLFSEGLAPERISADEVFKNLSDFYIINYIRKDKYDAGHIPGAIRYKPKGTLGIRDEMSTIPREKEIVVYCETGHNSGFVTAYLRLFGYNARTLWYGNNSFMYDKMVAEKGALSWLPFSDTEIENYPYEK